MTEEAKTEAVEARVLDSRPGLLGRLIARPAFWIAIVTALVLTPLAAAVSRTAPKPPPVLLELPSFRYTNEKNVPFGTEELRGKVWVASFAFTSCPIVCPKLMEKLAVVQHRTRNAGPGVHIVTFSVDPENDTPEKLASYARRFKASPYRWNFLTGDLAAIEATVIKGFKLAMGKDAENLFQVFHSERFALVDQRGGIRGYYEADQPGIDRMVRDIGLLLNDLGAQ